MSLFIVSLLIVSGPAQALIIGSDFNKQNKNIEFRFWMNPNSGENLAVSELKLELSTGQVCKFNVDGSVISGCDNLVIEKITAPDKPGNGPKPGYGYGYDNANNDRLAYKITLDSSKLSAGDYTMTFLVKIGNGKGKNQKYFSEAVNFKI